MEKRINIIPELIVRLTQYLQSKDIQGGQNFWICLKI